MASGSIGLTGEGEQQDDRRRDGKQAGGRCEVTNGSSTTIDDTTSRVEERPSAKRTYDDEREDRPPPRLGPMHEKSNPRRQAQPAAMATPTMSGGMRTASSSSQERVLSATQSVVRPIAAARKRQSRSTVRLPGVPVTQDRLLGVGAADQPNLRTCLLHQIGKLGTPACFRSLRLRGAARRLAGTAVNTLSSFAYVVAGAYVLRRVGLGRPHWHSRRLVSAASSTTDRCLPEPNSFTTGRSWRWRPRCQQPRR
jgi:hypothetical protein